MQYFDVGRQRIYLYSIVDLYEDVKKDGRTFSIFLKSNKKNKQNHLRMSIYTRKESKRAKYLSINQNNNNKKIKYNLQ